MRLRRIWAAIAVLLLGSLAPGAGRALAQSDPHLEPGFPVQALATGGIHHSGPAIHTLVGNIDADPELEIIVTGLASGPLYAWNHDGTSVQGWPVSNPNGAAYVGLGQIANDDQALEVFGGYMSCCGYTDLVSYDGNGKATPGWPRVGANYVATPPSAADINGDGLDELFIEEEDGALHGYRANGRKLPGWPQDGAGPQDMHTPAIGDLDGNGDLEIISATGSTSDGMYLNAWHHNGEDVTGFPVRFLDAWPDTFPVLGDVDGDGATEIVAIIGNGDDGTGHRGFDRVAVISPQGAIERQIELGVFAGFTAPALADLTGDGTPEIIIAAGNRLVVTTGLGQTVPGWPVELGDFNKEDSSPVVGDVDGDGEVDVALTVQNWSTHQSQIHVYDKSGSSLPGFPKTVPQVGSGGVPAIADIDLDGRNELVVSGLNWQGITDMLDRVWVYDLKGAGPYGPIPWGQFGGNSSHTSSYPLSQKQWPTTAPVIRGRQRSVRMRMSGHIVLTGRVSSEMPSCAKRVPIRVEHWLGSQWADSPGGKTDSEGRFRIKISDVEDPYRVALPFAWRGENKSQVCLQASSPTREHKH